MQDSISSHLPRDPGESVRCRHESLLWLLTVRVVLQKPSLHPLLCNGVLNLHVSQERFDFLQSIGLRKVFARFFIPQLAIVL